jgi:hypothetical protein
MTSPATRIKAATQMAASVRTGMGCWTETEAFVSVEEGAADIKVGAEVEELGFGRM